MKLKKLLTNKQYQKYLIKHVIQISACVFLLSIVFVAIWQDDILIMKKLLGIVVLGLFIIL